MKIHRPILTIGRTGGEEIRCRIDGSGSTARPIVIYEFHPDGSEIQLLRLDSVTATLISDWLSKASEFVSNAKSAGR